MRATSSLILASLITVAATPVATVSFEKSPQPLAAGPAKSPKFLSRRAQGLMAIYTAPGQRGADLMYISSNDVGESWTPPQRINHVPGEVSDHGENSPQLFLAPDEMTLYAFWNARDPQNPGVSHVRFSRGGAMMTTWSPAVTLDDDPGPNSHGFQGAAVGPDGTLYAAWLDMRDKDKAKTRNYTAGAAAVYLTTSHDGGATWAPNQRIATDVCPCCRVSFGFLGERAFVAWRGVDDGDLRDIYLASSEDAGRTWKQPQIVNRDNWKIKGCPHVGPSLATAGGRLHVTWFSEAGGKPGIFLASTSDGVKFSPKKLVSEGTTDPTHPYLAAYEDRLAVAFQARDASADDSWGKMQIFYREVRPDGSLAGLVKAPAPTDGSVTYPALALGMSGRTFLGWTQTGGEKGPQALLLRGRLKTN
jgi:hypothetical protein